MSACTVQLASLCPVSMKLDRTSIDLALAHINDGQSTAQTAMSVKVSQRTVQRWIKRSRFRRKGQSPRPASRKLATVLEFVTNRPGTCMEEIVEHMSETHGVRVSRFTAARIMCRHRITRKRGTRVNIRYDAEKGMSFLEDICSILIASIDVCHDQ